MVKIGVIQTVNFNPENYSEIVRNSFTDIEVGTDNCKLLFAFSEYIDGYQFYKVFNNHDELELWKLEYEWKYFLIPLDLVPAISHYSGFVKQTFPDLIFDVVLESQVIPVEGVNIQVPVTQIKMIPCNCTHWTDEGVQLLDAVIENWNTSVPSKQIDFQYAFESYDLFKAFRDEQIQVL